MGGVDPTDQFHKYYSVSCFCKKWYKDSFWFANDISICNAFILQNWYLTGAGKSKLKQGDFRKHGHSKLKSTNRRKLNQMLVFEDG